MLPGANAGCRTFQMRFYGLGNIKCESAFKEKVIVMYVKALR